MEWIPICQPFRPVRFFPQPVGAVRVHKELDSICLNPFPVAPLRGADAVRAADDGVIAGFPHDGGEDVNVNTGGQLSFLSQLFVNPHGPGAPGTPVKVFPSFAQDIIVGGNALAVAFALDSQDTVFQFLVD